LPIADICNNWISLSQLVFTCWCTFYYFAKSFLIYDGFWCFVSSRWLKAWARMKVEPFDLHSRLFCCCVSQTISTVLQSKIQSKAHEKRDIRGKFMSSTDLLNGRDRTDDNFHCGVFFCFLAEHVSVRLVITTQSLWFTRLAEYHHRPRVSQVTAIFTINARRWKDFCCF
jgi:hypothetical protein